MVLVTEGMLWPAERRLQSSLLTLSAGAPPEDSLRDARVVSLSATVAIVLLLVGSVLMVAQP